MNARFTWVLVAVAAFAAGAALWWSGRPESPVGPASISGAALYAVSFRDGQDRAQPLGQFQGRVLVLNFWATWCAPCREEMPGFDRLARRWATRGVAFVGVSDEAAEVVARFGQELRIGYPLWRGGDEAGEVARRLGNRIAALPFTAIIGPDGRVIAARVGPYGEGELENILAQTSSNVPANTVNAR